MLPDYSQLILYITAVLALNLTPGNDMLFCLGQGVKSGPRAGIAASLGIATGSLIYTVLAAIGLAAALAANPIALTIIRWIGVSYLVWLSIQALRQPFLAIAASSDPSSSSALQAYRQAIIVNLLNPKIAVFILAFIPQFIDPTKGSTIAQFLLLGLLLNVMGTPINALVGVYAGKFAHHYTRHQYVARAFQYLTCSIFLLLAARLAFTVL